MSAKKSWDIAPRARTAGAPAPKPSAPRASATPRTMRDMHAKPRPKAAEAPTKLAAPVSKKNVTITRGKKVRPESKEPLKKRRRKTQKVALIAAGILVLILALASLYVAWLPSLRVDAVTAEGPHAEEAKLLALRSIEGSHALVLPRDSLFFIPEEDIRAGILSAFPDIEAVSITADGLDTLHVKTLPRAEAFVWCGASVETSFGCFSANAEGLIFAPVSPETASTSDALRVYAPNEGQEGASPVGSRIGYASRIPEALRFVKAIQSLGASVRSVAFRDDEGDLYTPQGTRITYVLGREQEAAMIAASVFPQLALNDGSIDYIDLRFAGKAYFKRAGEAAPEIE